MTPSSSTPTADRAGGGSFPERVGVASREVVFALDDCLLEAGCDAGSAESIGAMLRIGPGLARRLAHLVLADGPREFNELLPGHRGRRFTLTALEVILGTASPSVLRLIAAFEAWAELRVVYAGDDEEVWRTMISGLAETPDAGWLIDARRRHHGASVRTMGVCARVLHRMDMVVPSQTPGRIDLVSLKGFLGFTRLRQDAAWTVATNGVAVWQRPEASRPIEPGNRPFEAPVQLPQIVPQFSTDPIPELEEVRNAMGGHATYRIAPKDLGVMGSSDLTFAYIQRDAGTPEVGGGYKERRHLSPMSLPARWLVFECYAHRSFEEFRYGRHALYAGVGMGTRLPSLHEQCDVLPCEVEVERVEALGAAVGDELVEKRGEMLTWLAEVGGVGVDELAGYRVVMPYPMVGSMPAIRFSAERFAGGS